MRLFRVAATVGRSVDGWWRTSQVPMFLLDGDLHGIRTEAEAEDFATRLLTGAMMEDTAVASACAVALNARGEVL